MKITNRPTTFLRVLPSGSAVLLLAIVSAAHGEEQKKAEFFEKRVRPILVSECYSCHSSQTAEPKGSLRVDLREHLLKGGDFGPAIIPGKSAESLLIQAVKYQDVGLTMPPKKRLTEQQIADLSQWINDGAYWPSDSSSGNAPSRSATTPEQFDLQARKQAHWAWQPIQNPHIPPVKQKAWCRSSIDHFIFAKLEARQLKLAPPASRDELIRRLYIDLIGMPPSVEEWHALQQDTTTGWYDRLVDRLLNSPRFGERWARHWLDLVGYAETCGHEFDFVLANAWPYRDYVIDAFNQDLRYDQFVTEQIAGDLLAQPRLSPQGRNQSIIGTTFWFLGEQLHSPVDIRTDQADRFDIRIDCLSKSLMGMTVACARCHDHKFDAISTADYYALYGFLSSTSARQQPVDAWPVTQQLAEELARNERDSSQRISQQVDALQKLLADLTVESAGPSGKSNATNPEAKVNKKSHSNSSVPTSLPNELATLVKNMKANQAQPHKGIDLPSEQVIIDFRKMDWRGSRSPDVSWQKIGVGSVVPGK